MIKVWKTKAGIDGLKFKLQTYKKQALFNKAFSTFV